MQAHLSDSASFFGDHSAKTRHRPYGFREVLPRVPSSLALIQSSIAGNFFALSVARN